MRNWSCSSSTIRCPSDPSVPGGSSGPPRPGTSRSFVIRAPDRALSTFAFASHQPPPALIHLL